MKGLNENIMSLGQKRDFKNLEALIESQEIDELCTVINHKICHPDALQLLNFIFLGLSDSGPSQVKRLRVTEHVLKVLQNREIGDFQSNAVLSRLSLEVDKLSSAHLIRLTNWCIENIQNGKGDQMSWKELLPKLLSVLTTVPTVDHSGTKLSGSEYKSQVINSLCVMKWRSEVVTSMAGMFADVPLSPDEHLQVVNKLCYSMHELDPSAFPPLVNQLLHLCRDQHGLPMFLQLQQYFSAKLYSQVEAQTDTNLTNMDLLSEEIVSGNVCEIRRAESTVLFYINQSASLGHASVKDLIKSFKSISNAPELVLTPFLLSVLLSISCIPSYEEQIFDILKGAITRVVMEEEKRVHSSWICEITPPISEIEKILTEIIENSVRERDMVKTGLVNLSFVLLSVSARGRDTTVERLWSYGTLILVRLVKKQHDVASTVLQTLCDRIIIGQGVMQYTDCLMKLSLTVPLLMSESQHILIHLLEQLMHIPGSIAQEVIRSMLHVVKTFPTLRDALILILRKALFCRTVSTRQMAVSGFLLLLKHLDVKNLAAVSQSSQDSSGCSYLSQVHSQPSGNNEAITLELLGILRRCFMQQAEVRLCLYQGLFEAVCKNPMLHPLVLELLLDHFHQFYVANEDVLPPLCFSKAVAIKDVQAVLQEPLTQLVFVLQQIVTKTSKRSANETTRSLTSLTKILKSLSIRMAKCTLEDFGLDNTTNLLDNLPESQQMYEMFKQMLGVYESLIGYTIASWTKETPEHHQQLVNLFKGYCRLVEFSKLSNKPGKKGEHDASHGQKRKRNEVGNKGKALKIIPSLLDFESVFKMLQLLYQRPLSWVSVETANQMRGRREFSFYVMQVTLQHIQQTKAMKSNDINRNPTIFGNCKKIGSILYQQCLDRLTEYRDEDCRTSVLSVECFLELLNVITLHFRTQLPHFLEDVVQVPRGNDVGVLLSKLLQKIQTLLEESVSPDDDNEDEPGVKKLPLLLVNILTLLTLEMPVTSPHMTEVFNWTLRFVQDKSLDCLASVNVAKGVLSLLFKLQIRYKTDGVLVDNIALQLLHLIGPIDAENRPEPTAQYALLTHNTACVCLQQLCGAIKNMLDDVDWVVARLRGEFMTRTYPSQHSPERRREFLKSKERDVCRHLSHCVKVVTVITKINLPNGPASDVMLKLLVNLYTTLSNLTKYFIMRSSKVDPAFQSARFTTVVELAAIELANRVHWLILHIMSTDSEKKDQEAEKGKKKKGVNQLLSKVLKDSKCIPKIVYQMELFEKFVIQLSNKTKVNLMEKVKPSTSRDFRIKMEVLQQALSIPDDNESVMEEETNAEEIAKDADSTAVSQPPKKKHRRSK